LEYINTVIVSNSAKEIKLFLFADRIFLVETVQRAEGIWGEETGVKQLDI
jgi:hypothetical protein